MKTFAGAIRTWAVILLSACGGGGGGTGDPPGAGPWSVNASTALANGGSGSIQCSANGGAAAPCGSYPAGTDIVASAVPDAVSVFSGWRAGPCSGNGDCRFTLAADVSLVAAFSRPVLTVQVNGTGTVQSTPAGIACPGTCAAAFDRNASVTLAASGGGSVSWSGGACAAGASCTITVAAASTVVATFTAGGLPPFALQAYLKATNPESLDGFGQAVALSGDTLAVGAQAEGSGAVGIGGNQADNSQPASGAVYVFVRSGGVWTQQAYIKASNTGREDRFGVAVALSGDTLVVGAEGERSNGVGVNGNQSDNSLGLAGAAYVFTRTAGVWTQQAYLKPSNTWPSQQFGLSVAIDGNTAVVGAPGESSGATGVNGNQTDRSIVNAGAAYVFVRNGLTWSQQAYLKASNTGTGDRFGARVAVVADTVAVSATGEASDARGVDGDGANDLAARSGAVYVFTRTGTNWGQQAYLKASNSKTNFVFGSGLALSADTLAAGATGEDTVATSSGAVYVFTRSGSTWSQQALLKASNAGVGGFTINANNFGSGLALWGDRLAVGAVGEDSSAVGVNGDQNDTRALSSGAVYVFARNAGAWSQLAYVKASNTGAGDAFGRSVAIGPDTLVVSANQEDSGSAGVNAAQADESATDAGAAYVYLQQ